MIDDDTKYELPRHLRKNAPIETRAEIAARSKSVQKMLERFAAGLTFWRLGGVGALSCDECEWTQEVDTFTHHMNGWTSDYQCQTCGKFASRSYTEPVFDIDQMYSTHEIERALSMIRACESRMQNKPKEEWLSSWEESLKYRAELRGIPDDVLAKVKRLRDDANAALEASLVCECGGDLDRDKILFCPQCRSKKLSFNMRYIT